MREVRLILVGGFLGAGKTTLLARAAKHFIAKGKRVGIITNDQTSDLVDTGLLKGDGVAVEEVSGGCFCCHFDDLVGASDRLLNQQKPDILLGEPVGSCTDISATVLQPLKELYANWFRVAPFAVLADPARLKQALTGGDSGFPDSVLYIFGKQLEEADLIVINKSDVLSADELAELKGLVAERLPETPVIAISALTGAGIDEWLDFVAQDSPAGKYIAAVDYDTYADGEAALGWLNASIQLSAGSPVDWRAFCAALLEDLQARLHSRSAEIAHLKLLLTTADGSLVGNVTSTVEEPRLQGDLTQASKSAHMVLNARAHVAPEDLQGVVESSIADCAGDNVSAEFARIQSFRPGRPEPTHRYGDVV